MNSKLSISVTKNLQALYKANDGAKQLFDKLAIRGRDARETSVDNIARTLDLYRGDAIELAKAIAQTGCADLMLGRRGGKTRLVWTYSCISIGHAAAGEAADLEDISDPSSDDELVDQAHLPAASSVVQHLTIAEAKARLAATLGVPASNIEIVIKA